MTEPAQLPLRDIHLPDPILWWPPAPGWWMLLCLLLIIVVVIWYWRRAKIRKRFSALFLAETEFSNIERQIDEGVGAKEIVSQLSVLLRRLSISLYPRSETAGLTGEAWLQFLDRPLPSAEFSNGPGRILIEAPYRPLVSETDIKPLIVLCHNWLEAVAKDKRGKKQ